MLQLPHGVARTATLYAMGVSRGELRRLLDDGALRRVRRGWFAAPGADPGLVRALALGGYLTCLSALAVHGLWIPETADLHLRFSEHHHRGRRQLPTTVRLCSPGDHLLRSSATPIDDLGLALVAASRCVSAEEFVAILDSALHRLRLSRGDLVGLLADAPAHVRRLIDLCDRAEAGTETLTRLRLRARGITVRPQVVIPGVGRVDLLVGRRLVLEIDSRAHHTGVENHTRDRTRDRRLHALGYLPVRLTYHQVIHGWDEVLPDLLAIIRRRDHLKQPRPGRTSGAP